MNTLYKSTTTGETLAVRSHANGTYTASDWLSAAEVAAIKSGSVKLDEIECDHHWTQADFNGMKEVR